MTADTPAGPPGFLAHNQGDSVAVAVRDLQPGSVDGGFLDDGSSLSVQLLDPVPLGHKLALRDLREGEDVIEYGVRVAVTTRPIQAGRYVHVHNVRSARWHSSVA